MNDIQNKVIIIFVCSVLYISTRVCVYFFNNVKDNRLQLAYGDPYTFATTSLPGDVRLWPSVGNGHISCVVYSQYVYMNGLYNGRGNQSHRAAIPSPLSANVTRINNEFPLSRNYVLLTREGVFREIIDVDDCKIILEWYAHRTILPLMVFEIEVLRSSRSSVTPLLIELNVSRLNQSPDINFSTSQWIKELAENELGTSSIYFRQGQTKESETDTSGKESVSYMYMEIPSTLIVGAGVVHSRWTFLASVHANEKEVFEAFHKGEQLLHSGTLRHEHTERWNATWNDGSVIVEGNDTIVRAVVGSQYYIFSSLPSTEDTSWPFVGLSPCGLAWGDSENYFGHVFWDQETWMYPPILLLHADLSWLLLQTRFRTIAAAAKNANLTGYRGLRYPWESAFTGVETTESDICAKQEIHINGDISFAVEQFWYANGDAEFLANTSRIVDVVFGIADFWISRLHFNDARQHFEINGVQPPDEYAFDVNNSAYTNVVARKSLAFASEIANILKMPEKQRLYENYASRMYIPFDAAIGYHPEYDGYLLGTTVKQADVILMGFPLMWNMTSEVRLKDLDTYEMVTSLRGPAMSDSMFAIGWLELQQYERAVKSFNKMFLHISGEFQVWTENKGGDGATNFITGMGGFMQSIIFGFGGIRLHSQYMSVDPVLPPGCTQLVLRSIDYRGNSLSMDIDSASVTLTLTSQGSRALCVAVGRQTRVLNLHQPISVAREQLQLMLCKAHQPLHKLETINANRNAKL